MHGKAKLLEFASELVAEKNYWDNYVPAERKIVKAKTVRRTNHNGII